MKKGPAKSRCAGPVNSPVIVAASPVSDSHFVAAGGDPLDFLRRHHERVVTLHLKDRKKNHGPDVPWGEGDVPIAAVLRMLRDERWTIPANIEYEYGKPGVDTVNEVKKCFDYCRKALET